MQCAIIEFARNVCWACDAANSTEFDPDTPHPVIDLLASSASIEDRRAARCGSAPIACRLHGGNAGARSSTARAGDQRAPPPPLRVQQRVPRAAARGAGWCCSGISPDGKLVEIVELPDHPWFLGCQFHPEFKSRPPGRTRSSATSCGAAAARAGASAARDAEAPVAARVPTRRSSPPAPRSGGDGPLLVIAGPCVVESRESALDARPGCWPASRGASGCRWSSRPPTTRPTARAVDVVPRPGARRGAGDPRRGPRARPGCRS